MEHNPKLTCAEVGFLWNHYMANTMSHCMFRHFLEHVEDKHIGDTLAKADSLSCAIVGYVHRLFLDNGIPLPIGFGDEDVDVKAPRLFSDSFYIMYLEMMIKLGAIFYALTMTSVSRRDLREYVSKACTNTMMLANEITDVMQRKGIYIRPPQIGLSGAKLVESESFFTGFFGEKRPLAGMEVSQLFSTHQLNAIKIPMLIGFSQVAQSQEVKAYFLRGRDYNIKQNKDVMRVLISEDVPIAIPSQFDITTSTERTFSDKLMMFHTAQLSSAKVRNFGDSIALSPRHDLAALYGKFFLETGKYAEDGGEIMIRNRWLEMPPHVPNRMELAKK